jgi:cell division protein FtsL
MPATSVYRFFQRADGSAASVRTIVIALVALAAALTTVGIVKVTHQHEVLRLGFELSRKSETVRQLREARRQLELEHATLTSPDRIRHLAQQLGMEPVAPDRIRIAHPNQTARNP